MKKVVLNLIVIIVVIAFIVILFSKKHSEDKEMKNNVDEIANGHFNDNEIKNAINDDKKVDENFYQSEEYLKIVNNKNDIKSVKKISNSEGEVLEETCDIDKAYEKIKSLKIKGKTDIEVLDADSQYVFEFNDGSEVKIYFEGSYLRYNNQNYELEK